MEARTWEAIGIRCELASNARAVPSSKSLGSAEAMACEPDFHAIDMQAGHKGSSCYASLPGRVQAVLAEGVVQADSER